jgi:hypothetical protein
MKFAKLIIVTLASFSPAQHAFALSQSCQRDLTKLVVPPLQHVAVKKKEIRTSLDENSDGVYSIRLFVAADSPDNLDRQVTIGWANIDSNNMKVIDVTNEDSQEELNVSPTFLASFVKKCLGR